MKRSFVLLTGALLFLFSLACKKTENAASESEPAYSGSISITNLKLKKADQFSFQLEFTATDENGKLVREEDMEYKVSYFFSSYGAWEEHGRGTTFSAKFNDTSDISNTHIMPLCGEKVLLYIYPFLKGKIAGEMKELEFILPDCEYRIINLQDTLKTYRNCTTNLTAKRFTFDIENVTYKPLAKGAPFFKYKFNEYQKGPVQLEVTESVDGANEKDFSKSHLFIVPSADQGTFDFQPVIFNKNKCITPFNFLYTINLKLRSVATGKILLTHNLETHVKDQESLAKGYIKEVWGNVCGPYGDRLLYYRNIHPTKYIHVTINHNWIDDQNVPRSVAQYYTIPPNPDLDYSKISSKDVSMGCPVPGPTSQRFRWDLFDAEF